MVDYRWFERFVGDEVYGGRYVWYERGGGPYDYLWRETKERRKKTVTEKSLPVLDPSFDTLL